MAISATAPVNATAAIRRLRITHTTWNRTRQVGAVPALQTRPLCCLFHRMTGNINEVGVTVKAAVMAVKSANYVDGNRRIYIYIYIYVCVRRMVLFEETTSNGKKQ